MREFEIDTNSLADGHFIALVFQAEWINSMQHSLIASSQGEVETSLARTPCYAGEVLYFAFSCVEK